MCAGLRVCGRRVQGVCVGEAGRMSRGELGGVGRDHVGSEGGQTCRESRREQKCVCSMRGSNPRPLAHKTNTLPTELMEPVVGRGGDKGLPTGRAGMISVRGLVVMIVACQVMDPGSIPGERIFWFLGFWFFGVLLHAATEHTGPSPVLGKLFLRRCTFNQYLVSCWLWQQRP